MSKNTQKTSEAQPFPAFPTFDNPYFEAWQESVQSQMNQAQSVYSDMQSLYAQNVAKMTEALDEMSTLFKAQIAHMQQLQNDMSKITLDAVNSALQPKS